MLKLFLSFSISKADVTDKNIKKLFKSFDNINVFMLVEQFNKSITLSVTILAGYQQSNENIRNEKVSIQYLF